MNNLSNADVKLVECWKDRNGHVWTRIVIDDKSKSEKTCKLFHVDENGFVSLGAENCQAKITDIEMPSGVKYKDLPIK